MSNCHLVAARSLIDWAASRLALRAPALREATALTRPNRSAQRLPCGRHAVQTAVTVGPDHVVANHGVERGDHLAHHHHDRNVRQFASGFQAIVESFERRTRRAKLVIAKLDRLSCNLAFIATLMDSNVEFVCCDMPTRLSISKTPQRRDAGVEASAAAAVLNTRPPDLGGAGKKEPPGRPKRVLVPVPRSSASVRRSDPGTARCR